MNSVKSAAIEAHGYDAATKTVRIRFSSGWVHEYPGVEPAEYDALHQAESAGKHFNANFRGRDHVRIS